MIDKNVFAEGMGRLAGAFGREVDGPVSALYFRVLGPVLDDVSFLRAVERTAAEETFWPTPAKILEKAGADAESRSLAAFKHMREIVASHGGYRFLPNTVYQEFDAPTKAAIKECGGLAEIANTTESKWSALVKKFCKAYTEATNPTPRLASGGLDPRVKQLVRGLATEKALPTGDRA